MPRVPFQLLTAYISDLANHVGCCLGLPASTTAITLVALGTSLPDTFASRSAAASEPHADASLGNITGSNAVNVFLGLGLPETVPEWGSDLQQALNALPTGVWWTALYPGVAMFVLVLGLSFRGEGLESWLSGSSNNLRSEQ